MNTKDYKEIAKIMKWYPNALVTEGYKEGLEDGRNNFCKRLADYFEGDEIMICNDGSKKHFPSDFDRKQFLKDCGIELNNLQFMTKKEHKELHEKNKRDLK